jgi:hypothetical protein
MKKYYIHNETAQEGPFGIEDLKAKFINKDTVIWYDGLPNWTTANKIDELKEMFNTTTPPPFDIMQKPLPPPINKQVGQVENNQSFSTPVEQKMKISSGKSITIIVIIFIVIGCGLALLYSMNNDSGNRSTGNTYQEKVMTVEEIERASPTDFLIASGTFKENFWGNKFKVTVVVTNKATVAKYKDAVIKITYYSKTETVLGSKEYTIYEKFPPTSTKTVELKIEKYKDVSSLGWKVIQAKLD